MPKVCNKLAPSELDHDVWRMFALEGRSREAIAERLGKSQACIDYHIAEGKRLIGIDVAKAKEDSQRFMIPIAFQGLQLIAKTFATQNPKYVDAAIKFLRNAGYTIETQELNVNHKDTSSPDQSFESVMQRFKSRSVDADISDVTAIDQPGINASASDQPAIGESISEESTPTSISKSSDSILPLPQSHTKNPKSDQESPRSDIPLKPMSRDEDY